eukprot:scaffold4658_cov118-Cylindrotheca_fusiformis.AAC.22
MGPIYGTMEQFRDSLTQHTDHRRIDHLTTRDFIFLGKTRLKRHYEKSSWAGNVNSQSSPNWTQSKLTK